MSRLDPTTYLRHLRDESQRFRDVLTDCDPAAEVPSCPEWQADDLLWHLGEVQHFWTWVVTHRPQGPDAYPEPTRPSEHAGLLDFFDEHLAGLHEALSGAEPSEAAWTWHPEHHDIAFILRRQAHEALIHRRDAELTTQEVTAFPVDLAADGVDEVLDVMYGGCPPWGSFSPLPHYVRIDLTDTAERIWVQLGHFHGTDPEGVEHDEDDIHVVGNPGLEPDAVISGTAEVLDARIWRRGDGADTHLAGDLAIIDRFRSVIHQPIT